MEEDVLVGEESDVSDAEPGPSNDERAVPERADRDREPPRKSRFCGHFVQV